MSDDTSVQVGQVWQDNDRRHGTRYLRIDAIDQDRAVCVAWYDEAGAKSRVVRIRLDRFKPTSTGYRLLPEEEAAKVMA